MATGVIVRHLNGCLAKAAIYLPVHYIQTQCLRAFLPRRGATQALPTLPTDVLAAEGTCPSVDLSPAYMCVCVCVSVCLTMSVPLVSVQLMGILQLGTHARFAGRDLTTHNVSLRRPVRDGKEAMPEKKNVCCDYFWQLGGKAIAGVAVTSRSWEKRQTRRKEEKGEREGVQGSTFPNRKIGEKVGVS